MHIDSKLKMVDILKFIMNIPLRTNNYQGKKRICDFCKDQVEDEQHFIPECKLNENLRQGVFSDPEKPIQLWNESEKMKYFSKQQANLLYQNLQNLSVIPLKNTENIQ